MRLTFSLLMCVLLLSGCWSRNELNDIAIAEGVGIDISGDQFEFSVQIVNPDSMSKTKGEQALPIIVYAAKGVTLNEAVKRLASSISRKVYFSHIRILVLSEELAQRGVSKSMDYLQRSNEFRSDFNVVIAKGSTAKEVLSVMTPLEKVPSNYIFNSIEVSSKEWSPTVSVKLDQLSDDIVAEGKNAVLSGIQIVGNTVSGTGTNKSNVNYVTPPVRLRYFGNGVFKNDRLVGWLNENESRAYSVITDHSKRSSMHVGCPEGGNIGLDIERGNTKVYAKVKNDKPEIFIESRFVGQVSDVECVIDLTKLDTINYVIKQALNFENGAMEQSIRKAQSLGSDIFGFGEAVHRADPNYWSRVKGKWESQFKQLEPHLNIEFQIRNTGTIGKSVVGEEKG
ncbi:Ger(x)C family spore germination protein [Paenibacillus plantarum]|uniref:Ger(x)C family spore germination protein n=1 Tax=Paenibacillus plantarum TaxID=2654975 RepID=UPI0028A9D991|nr:Ger(x)C family spore germination protein [Paenibacillus plantarum]